MDSYINGSDLLVNVGGGAVGHSTTCTITFNSETKERAVKPLASLPKSAGLWKEKGITGLSISIKADGLRVYEEKEKGFEEIAPNWGKGDSVEVTVYGRSDDTHPIIQGKFIISLLEMTAPAQDDTTYTISLENAGMPDVYPGKTTSDT